MKTIGLLGGMSWESTQLYYRCINEETRRIRGGLHSAPIVMVSVDFEPIERLQHVGDWDGTAQILSARAREIQAAGADFLLICTNTMHKVADQIGNAIDIPLLHLADATASQIKAAGHDVVGLLGTRFTMAESFYKERLIRAGLQVIVPDEPDQQMVHQIIYDELCQGVIRNESRDTYLRIIERLGDAGAQCIIQGCTEIVLLVQQQHTDMPLFDTTAIHARQAVAVALS